MRLLFITNVPTPYRVDFFNELGKQCDLTVLFERSNASDRDPAWSHYDFEHFHGIVLKGIPIRPDTAVCIDVLKHLRRGRYDAVVVTNFTSPTGMLAVGYLRATRQTYYLESDGGFPRRTGLRSLIKRLIIPGARGYFSTSLVHDQYYLACGAKAERLIRYPFSSVHAAEVLAEPPASEVKVAAKRALGLSDSPLILCVSQFIPRKGIDVLLRALPSIDHDATVCIIGGRPPREYTLSVESLNLRSVHFLPFKTRSQLQPYFLAADVFVLPTREDIWGLVVNEALAHALPVVTTDRCLAGVALVEDDQQGYIVPSADEGALAGAINKAISRIQEGSRMPYMCLKTARQYTIESMAFEHLRSLSRRRKGELYE